MQNTSNHLILSSSSIEGTNVKNLSDEKLGDIKDIMLDVDTGRIVYAVLSVSDGFLGLDNKYFAIPWQAIRFDTSNEIALLDVSKEKLQNSPGFDKDNWPTSPQREFVDDVHTFYGYDPFYSRNDKETVQESNTNNAGFNRNIGDSDAGFNRNTGDSNIAGNPNLNNPGLDRDVNAPDYNRNREDDSSIRL